MGMTPSEYFGAFVVENQIDYEEHPESVRHAFNAAVPASHMADHYYFFSLRHKPDSRFANRKALLAHADHETGGAFGCIRSIANVYKHLYATGSDCEVTSAGAIEAIEIEDDPDVRELVSEVQYDKGTVYFTTKNGQRREFGAELNKVVEFWRRFLGER